MVYGHLVVDDLRDAVAKLPSMPMLAPPKPVALLPPARREKRVEAAVAARRASSRVSNMIRVHAEDVEALGSAQERT